MGSMNLGFLKKFLIRSVSFLKFYEKLFGIAVPFFRNEGFESGASADYFLWLGNIYIQRRKDFFIRGILEKTPIFLDKIEEIR